MLKLQTFLPAAVVIMRSNLVLGFINSNMLWKRLPFVLTEHRIVQIHLEQENLNHLSIVVSLPKHRVSRKNGAKNIPKIPLQHLLYFLFST